MLLPPLAVYVHVPWCVRKCPYCDFNSHSVDANNIPEHEFLKQLKADILQDSALAQGRKISSVFFGGGTPSLLSGSAIAEIIDDLNNRIGLERSAEITLEANPGTAEADKFQSFQKAGVNRLSIGVQSFDDSFLKSLGRIHDSVEAIRAVEFANNAGITNYNIDLMHGLPNQSEEQALADIHRALELNPNHLSWYQLTIEQNTEFYANPPALPEDDTLWAIQQAGQKLLAENGLKQYEVSAYSKENMQSRHNLNYWQYGDYIGVGPGAHGKYTRINGETEIIRTRKTRLPKDYLRKDRPLVRHEEVIETKDKPFDYFVNTFRLRQASRLTEFEQRTGLSRNAIAPVLNQLEDKAWVTINDDLISITDSGFLYLNDVLSYWLD